MMTPELMQLLESLGVSTPGEDTGRQHGDSADQSDGEGASDAQLLLALLEEGHRIQAALFKLLLQPLIQSQASLLRSILQRSGNGTDRPAADGLLEVLSEAQAWILQHPIAAQAVFAKLVAEGRRFAETETGATLARELAGSEEVQTWRLAFESMTANVLVEDPQAVMPTTYLDALRQLGDSGGLADLINESLRPATESGE